MREQNIGDQLDYKTKEEETEYDVRQAGQLGTECCVVSVEYFCPVNKITGDEKDQWNNTDNYSKDRVGSADIGATKLEIVFRNRFSELVLQAASETNLEKREPR